MNNRPLGKRKQVQLLVVLTLLAWATQTLLHQWGYGQEVAPASPTDQTAPAAARRIPSATKSSFPSMR